MWLNGILASHGDDEFRKHIGITERVAPHEVAKIRCEKSFSCSVLAALLSLGTHPKFSTDWVCVAGSTGHEVDKILRMVDCCVCVDAVVEVDYIVVRTPSI